MYCDGGVGWEIGDAPQHNQNSTVPADYVDGRSANVAKGVQVDEEYMKLYMMDRMDSFKRT